MEAFDDAMAARLQLRLQALEDRVEETATAGGNDATDVMPFNIGLPPVIPAPDGGGGGEVIVPGAPVIEGTLMKSYFCRVKTYEDGTHYLEKIEPPEQAWSIELETHVSNHTAGVL